MGFGSSGTPPPLDESAVLFHTLVENALAGIYLFQDGRMIYVNSRMEEIVGRPAEEILKSDIFEFIHPEDREMARAKARKRLEGIIPPESYRIRILHPEKGIRWVLVLADRIDYGGKPAILGNIMDITEQVEADERIKKSEELFRTLFEMAPDPIFLVGPSGEFIDGNKAAERLTGYRKEKLIGKDFWSAGLLPPDQAKKAVSIWEKMRRGQAVRAERLTLIQKDGSRVEVEIRGSLARMDDREIFIGIARDLTERREWEAWFEGLFHGAPLAIAILDREGKILKVNEAFERLFQYEAEEAHGAFIWELIHPPHKRQEGQRNRQVVLSGSVVRMESQRMKKDGSLVEVSITGYPIRFGREIRGIYAIYEDITERKKAQQALERAQRRYKELVEQVQAGICEIDVESLRFTNVNDYMCHLFGYSKEEFLKLTVYDLWTEEGKKLVKERQQRILQGLPVSEEVEYTGLTKVGRQIWVRAHAAFGLSEEGRPVARVVMTDETRNKRLEAQLLQAQRMEAVGRLAGGVAHDINNALTSVLGYADIILSSVKEDHPIYEAASEIKEGARRASRTIQQLLAFSRRQIIQPQVLDLNLVIQQMQKMLTRLIGEDIRLEVHLGSTKPMIFADRGQMEQVLMNLVVNARDAMPEGGTLTIETADVELDEEYARSHEVELEPGPYVMLAVSDTGVGMDEETQRQVFEPFFTTKEVGKGTGLGLSTVYGIVKQNKGYIWVYSEPGRGSTFKIYLPRAQGEEMEGILEGPSASSPPGHGETVLVVEDEEGLLRLVKISLERMGYRVLAASDPQGALSLVRLHSGPIHLLLTDVVLPGMSGKTLADMILVNRPETKVIFMSGYTQNAIAHHGVLERGIEFIQKPFTPEEIARKVREVLDK